MDLPAPRGADDGQPLARAQREAHVVEDVVTVAIGVSDSLDLEGSVDRTVPCRRAIGRHLGHPEQA